MSAFHPLQTLRCGSPGHFPVPPWNTDEPDRTATVSGQGSSDPSVRTSAD
jgi:hypothetical protein